MQLLSFMHLTFHLLCYLETHLPPAQTIKCQLCSLQSPDRPVGLHNLKGVVGGECQAFLYILRLQRACFIHHGPFLWGHSLCPSLICSTLRNSTCSSKGWLHLSFWDFTFSSSSFSSLLGSTGAQCERFMFYLGNIASPWDCLLQCPAI